MKTDKSPRQRDVYLDLIREFPLRPIRSDVESDRAESMLDRYFARDDLDAGTSDYVHALATLVADYQERKHPVDTSRMTGLAMLKHLMEQNEMSTADLGRLLGNSGLASMIVHGKRAISKANAKVLGKRFGLDAGAFI
jgi:HTH-type transcriptional regulator/antitoxin HigA